MADLPDERPHRVTSHEWIEDELYGRYEVRLKIDVGSSDQALEVARLLRGFIDEWDPPRLGHELETIYIVGGEHKRISGKGSGLDGSESQF